MWAALLPALYSAMASTAVGAGFHELTKPPPETDTMFGQPSQMQTPDIVNSLLQQMQNHQKGQLA